jgi:hypothetical protein
MDIYQLMTVCPQFDRYFNAHENILLLLVRQGVVPDGERVERWEVSVSQF